MKGLLGLTAGAIILACTASASFAQNYKIKQIVTMAGTKSESSVFVKGPRKRTQGGMMGIGADVATIEQCDLKRNIKVSDTKKKYFVTPFPDTSSDPSPTSSRGSQTPPGKATKGGTLTITSSIVDTGERKQMFGLTARHVKSSMKMEASPDACNQQNMHIETDGWYVDLPQFSCPLNGADRTVPYQQPPSRTGCQDRTILKESGGGKLGFALQSTMKMDGGNGQSFTQSLDTIEFSKVTLDDALFDIPVGYTITDKEQNLYGAPNYAEMMGMAKAMENNEQSTNQPPVVTGSTQKRAGVKRICVTAPTNSSGENFQTDNLQTFLVGQLSSQNVDAVAISKEADTKASSCDYVLTSNFSKMKQSSGGIAGSIMGKITKTDLRTWETQVDFLLTSVSDGRSVLKNKAVMKAGGNADLAAQNVLTMEASSVLSAVK